MANDGGVTSIVRIIARLNIGGPSIHAVILSRELNRNGYRSTLVTGPVTGAEGDMAYLARSNGIEPVVLPELGREISLKNDIRSFFKLVSILRGVKPDIVHTHTAKAGALGRLAAVFAGVPIKVHTFHGHIFDGYFSPLKAKVFAAIERFLALFTTKTIVVSDEIRREIAGRLKIVPPDKCVVIRLGLDLGKFLDSARFKGAFKKKLGLAEDTLLVGIVGRLVPIKNHYMFLDVVATVKKDTAGRDVKFVIIGDGEARGGLESRAKAMGIADSVIFTGWIKNLEEVYPDLDVVAITSINEGTPVSLIEAMASGKPVIATDVGGMRDVVIDGSNGLLVESGDVKGFSARLIELLRDAKKRAEMGCEGRRLTREKYSSERLVRDIRMLYEECLENKRKGRR